MFEVVEIKDTVRVPPETFGDSREEVVLDILRKNYEGMVDNNMGVVLSIIDVEEVETGKVVMGEAASFHNVVFKALFYKPMLHEITPGEVVEIVDFGAFVRLGAMDGLAHVSQITDDYINYDRKKNALIGKETKRSSRKATRSVQDSLDKHAERRTGQDRAHDEAARIRQVRVDRGREKGRRRRR